MQFPFEVDFDEIQSDPNPFVDAIFNCLESDFLVMPKDEAFIEFATFEAGYEALKRATRNFHDVSPEKVKAVVFEVPVSLIVCNCHCNEKSCGRLKEPDSAHGVPPWPRSPPRPRS